MITIIALGIGGNNISRDIIDAKLFDSVNLLVCNTDPSALPKHSARADGNLLLQTGEDLIQHNKVKIVKTLNNINSDEIIITSSLNESAGQHFTYPIAFAESPLEKSVTIISTMSFSDEDGRRIYDTNKKVNWKFMGAFDFLLIQNNSTAVLSNLQKITW